MSKVTVCVRFRPLNSREKRDHGDAIRTRSLGPESFVFKDEKEEDITFSFDRVFYPDSTQVDVYEYLAVPIVQDVVNGINGTVITYGQTGAGKTYSMEGSSLIECNEEKKGLLPRVVDGLFEYIKSAVGMPKYTVKLSMVEIYMEKVRDLFDLSKDNLQIKEGKGQGIYLSGATEICIMDPGEALRYLSEGITNRAVGETQMNMASSRSHCVYIFSVQLEATMGGRVKIGKLILVDLAGSEKVEKTGAEGRVLEEAKTINKSLSALGNVIKALTNGKINHIPYRDSKLTRFLQDALGGNSRTALLCCCSPSFSNASESLSTLRFGARTKHIKTPPRVTCNEEKCGGKHAILNYEDDCQTKTESRERILEKLRENLDMEDVKMLEELLVTEGIIFYPHSLEDLESACEDVINQTIFSLQQAVEELTDIVEKITRENIVLKSKVAAIKPFDLNYLYAAQGVCYSGASLGNLVKKTGYQSRVRFARTREVMFSVASFLNTVLSKIMPLVEKYIVRK